MSQVTNDDKDNYGRGANRVTAIQIMRDLDGNWTYTLSRFDYDMTVSYGPYDLYGIKGAKGLAKVRRAVARHQEALHIRTDYPKSAKSNRNWDSDGCKYLTTYTWFEHRVIAKAKAAKLAKAMRNAVLAVAKLSEEGASLSEDDSDLLADVLKANAFDVVLSNGN